MTLGQYIRELVACLRQCDSRAHGLLCEVVGTRTARMQLDNDSVHVRIRDKTLEVAAEAWDGRAPDGEGATDSATVRALLRGDLELGEAILNGSLVVFGETEAISRIFQAIELLLDAAPRCPALQILSRQFVAEETAKDHPGCYPRAPWYPFAVGPTEWDLLGRHGLLPP